MTADLDVTIQGESMWPTFREGDVLQMASLQPEDELAVGDVVLAQHPLKTTVLLVKRIHRIEDDGRLFLVGDQPDPTASEDSHNFGSVPPENIRARWGGEVKRA